MVQTYQKLQFSVLAQSGNGSSNQCFFCSFFFKKNEMRFFFEGNRREAPTFFEGFGVFCSIFRFLKDFSFFLKFSQNLKKNTASNRNVMFWDHKDPWSRQ